MATPNMKNLSHNYYQHIRREISNKISRGNHRVLDIGCGAGNFGAYLKQQGCALEVVGIEINQIIANEAANKIDHVICADLNRIAIKELLTADQDSQFDYIVCADILEHLINPWGGLSEIVELLKPDGKIIVSLPNVRHWSVWVPLIFIGQWHYQDSGILDKTHLRFFTHKTSMKLIADVGLELLDIQPNIWRKSERVFNFLTLGMFKGIISGQWILVGKKTK